MARFGARPFAETVISCLKQVGLVTYKKLNGDPLLQVISKGYTGVAKPGGWEKGKRYWVIHKKAWEPTALGRWFWAKILFIKQLLLVV